MICGEMSDLRFC